MFEFLKKLSSPSRLSQPNSNRDDVVFWVDLPQIPDPASEPTPAPSRVKAFGPMRRSVAATREVVDCPPTSENHFSVVPQTPSVVSSHRERLLAMRLEYLKLCPAKRCAQLAAVGIQTAGDLVFGDPKKISASFDSPERAERALRRYRTAIRMSLAVESMMPRDALLLVAIHRRSVVSLARESAAQLHRDLERFSLSTRGRKLVGRRGIPSLRRVKAWVAACRELAEIPRLPVGLPG